MTHHKHHPIKPHHKTHNTPSCVTRFIDKLLPIAKLVKNQYGVPIAVTIAQAAQETGWGRHVKGNAYFGVKGYSADGGSVEFTTHEVDNNRSRTIVDTFRSYPGLQEAANDYGQFLKNSPRYAPCFAYTDQPERFVETLADAGYATDPDYAKNLNSIIRSYSLAGYDTPTTKVRAHNAPSSGPRGGGAQDLVHP
jgi:flagellum-specific peptidoglycan hydrolase FlgJ